MTSKQRKVLQAIASVTEPIGQVGKGGISENMLRSFSNALDKRELIKITLLQNADGTPRAVGEELAAALRAELVIAIGRKIVLYRRSEREDVEHIEF